MAMSGGYTRVWVNDEAISKQLPEFLDDLTRKQIPFATALALTRVAMRAKARVTRTIPHVFDRPRPFTRNSVFMKAAKKRDLAATVWLKDSVAKGTPASQYLWAQIYGGQRNVKRFERRLSFRGLLPANSRLIPTQHTPLDNYGNIKGSFLTRLLSAFDVLERGQGETENTKKRRRRTSRDRGFFIPRRGSKGLNQLTVYQRFTFGFGNAVKPVLTVARGSVNYKVRFPIHRIAEHRTGQHFATAFGPALKHAVATAGAKTQRRFESNPVAKKG